MGWEYPVGKYVYRDYERKIIGVVNDFNYSSLHSPISPVILNLVPYAGFKYIIVKFKTGNFSEFIEKVEQTWKSIDPNEPFDYNFLEAGLKEAYEKEYKFSQLFMIFALLATLLASLGLFGLAAFEAEKRKKEIGIRKVLGSTVSNITGLLISRFLTWVLVANMIAWPVSWFMMKSWLNNFNYKTTISLLFFLAAAILSVVVAVITVWSRSYRIANLNPADSIRSE